MITKNDKRLGKKIRKLRRKNKLTQEQLAEKARVTPKYIQYIESAKRVPSLKLTYRIARVLGVKAKDLFTF
jgi:transcriptional regulator with XRE-family HTH domain